MSPLFRNPSGIGVVLRAVTPPPPPPPIIIATPPPPIIIATPPPPIIIATPPPPIIIATPPPPIIIATPPPPIIIATPPPIIIATPPPPPTVTYYWSCCGCVGGCQSYASSSYATAYQLANDVCDGAGSGLCYFGTTQIAGCGPCL